MRCCTREQRHGGAVASWANKSIGTEYQITGVELVRLLPLPVGWFKLPNRVDSAGGLPSFFRQRIETVTAETGSVITASPGGRRDLVYESQDDPDATCCLTLTRSEAVALAGILGILDVLDVVTVVEPSRA